MTSHHINKKSGMRIAWPTDEARPNCCREIPSHHQLRKVPSGVRGSASTLPDVGA